MRRAACAAPASFGLGGPSVVYWWEVVRGGAVAEDVGDGRWEFSFVEVIVVLLDV